VNHQEIDMDTNQPSMTNLFNQLGLPSEPQDIADFIDAHRPLPEEIRLTKADFWSTAQASFMEEKLSADDHWAVVIDSLNTSLRAAH
jgi:hypothetical protein